MGEREEAKPLILKSDDWHTTHKFHFSSHSHQRASKNPSSLEKMKLSTLCLALFTNDTKYFLIQLYPGFANSSSPRRETVFLSKHQCSEISDKCEQSQAKEGLLMYKEKQSEDWKQRQGRLTVEVRASEIPTNNLSLV